MLKQRTRIGSGWPSERALDRATLMHHRSQIAAVHVVLWGKNVTGKNGQLHRGTWRTGSGRSWGREQKPTWDFWVPRLPSTLRWLPRGHLANTLRDQDALLLAYFAAMIVSLPVGHELLRDMEPAFGFWGCMHQCKAWLTAGPIMHEKQKR